MLTPAPRPITTRLLRLLRHRWMDRAHVHRTFSPAALKRITHAIANGELRHTGQLRICIEASLPTSYVWRDLTPQDRALTLFGKFRLWDTDERNGVLLYLLLAEHDIELIVDRGLSERVSSTTWHAVADRLSQACRDHRFEEGMLSAIDEISALMASVYPRAADQVITHPLDDRPIVL